MKLLYNEFIIPSRNHAFRLKKKLEMRFFSSHTEGVLSTWQGLTQSVRQGVVVLFSLFLTGITLNAEPISTYALQKTIKVNFLDFTVFQKSTIKLNVFINGGEVATLFTDSLKQGDVSSTITFKTTNANYHGIGEIVIEGIGAFPLIMGDNLADFNVKKENLTTYLPNTESAELKALGAFLTIYRGYENMLAHYNQVMISPFGKYTSDEKVYEDFLKDYTSFRHQFNLFFAYAQKEHPASYITRLGRMFVQNEQITTWKEARDQYFVKWNFADSCLLNNPLFDRQLAIYNQITHIPAIQSETAALDGLYNNLTANKTASKLLNDHIRNYTIINLFQQNKNGDKDKTIEYYYNHWLSNEMESCSEEAEANKDAVFQKAFFKRLSNISKVKEGDILPEVSGYTEEGKLMTTGSMLKKTPFTVLFLWSSTCTHCEEYAPQLAAFANAHKDKVQVMAYSIDKTNTQQNWKKAIINRKNLTNWIDVAEINDMQSYGISNICYMGTPSIFLIDQTGTIISKSTDFKELSQQINFKRAK
jgi:thiol-disulfide isomerase/thioredoxin